MKDDFLSIMLGLLKCWKDLVIIGKIIFHGKINLLIENFAVEETGKNRGRIQQLILENDLPELRKNLEERTKIY